MTSRRNRRRAHLAHRKPVRRDPYGLQDIKTFALIGVDYARDWAYLDEVLCGRTCKRMADEALGGPIPRGELGRVEGIRIVPSGALDKHLEFALQQVIGALAFKLKMGEQGVALTPVNIQAAGVR